MSKTIIAANLARILAVTQGAYGLTVQVTVVLSLLLAAFGLSRVEAVIAATLASFAVFHAASVARAWLWLVVVAVPLEIV